ncbi:hypothetical protein [Streptomyces sp. MK37H]|uniref:hypothetical protein n=1 Tax=Streptomyces sp. MK37H TaxID=2699117 RepID=UPI0035A81F2D
MRQAELLDDPGPMDTRGWERVRRLREAIYILVRPGLLGRMPVPSSGTPSPR